MGTLGIAFHRSVELAAPAEEVVRVLCDVAGWPRWNASVVRLDRPASGALTVGETVRLKQHRLPANTWTVTRVDGSGFVWTASSPGVHTTGDHRVRPTGPGRSEATLTLRMAGPLARLTALFGGRTIRRYLELEADGLRREVERDAAR